MDNTRTISTWLVAMIISLFSVFTLAEESTDTFIAEFNDSSIGVAFSMLSEEAWKNPGQQNFHNTPTVGQAKVQAVTISNASKEIWPYPADSRYGLIFSISSSSNFYQYFATKSAFSDACAAKTGKMVTPMTKESAVNWSSFGNWAVECGGKQIAFCGRCSDGGPCAGVGTKPVGNNGVWPALGDQIPYEEFAKAKNAIVEKTGSSCTQWIHTKNAWNEFDTNGLSPSALRGVMIDGITPGAKVNRPWVPEDSVLCEYLNNADPSRTGEKWPIYTLASAGTGTGKSTLTQTGSVDCSGD